MVEIEIDGRKVEVSEGSMVMHAAEKLGTFIPHFCYHKKLSIAANCRMCLVDVEKAPKAVPACATPVTQGMVVRTQSDRATKAQRSVMEFLLINHPLDCPICDQGGECQLQDLAVGYGAGASRYEEEKRVVFHKDVGPLISMEEMSRCIHCTRCVRFGQEIAGVMELGMSHRGEHSEIESFVGQTVDSELSGNMIDVCPVGALTSKPFRYQARTWELGRRKSVSPHDATGANLIIQVKNHQVMRVVPLENEAVNECWIADRDRFSYEALNGEDRLTRPMIKQGGQWIETDWTTALDYVVRGIQDIHHQHGPSAIGALTSPHSTVEELHLMQQLIRSLGSDHIDSRLRAAEPGSTEGVRWLGMPLADLSNLQRVLVVGGHLRKDQPLMAQRIRQAARRGAQIHAIVDRAQDWALPIRQTLVAPAGEWAQSLASVAQAIADLKGVTAPSPVGAVSDAAKAIAQSLCSGEHKAILLGNAAVHHVRASSLLALAQWIAEQTGARFGHLGEAANTVGAQVVGAVAQGKGKTATQMLQPGALRAVFLLQVEPGLDTAAPADGLQEAGLVVSLSPFKANAEVADVMLPISPFTETAGTFINTEGRAQSFHGVVRPLGDTRPAWKVLRVLGNLLGLSGFDMDSVEEVRALALPAGWEKRLSNATRATIDALPVNAEPVTASIYQLDALVRRAPALQRTADAREGRGS